MVFGATDPEGLLNDGIFNRLDGERGASHTRWAESAYSQKCVMGRAHHVAAMKAVALIFCLAVLLPVPLLAAEPSAKPAAAAATPRAAPNSPGRRFATPTRFDQVGRIVAPVMIDGQGPFRFLVDTGADGSMISRALVRKLGLVPERGAAEQVQGTTGSQQLPWVPIATLEVGGIVKHDLRMPICRSRVLSGLDGILGMAGFGAARVVVNFRENRVIIDRSSNGPVAGFLDIHAKRTPGGLLMIPARVGDVHVKAVIDTGAAVSLGNSALHTALVRDAARKGGSTKIFGVTRQVSNGGMVASPTIFLGPVAIRNLAIVYSDIPIFKTWHLESTPAIIIGMNVLGAVNTLVLDYPRARIYLQPVPSRTHSVGVQDMYVSSPLLPGKTG